MPIVLRPFQQQMIDDTRQAYREGARAPLVVAPTGSGKTVFFSAVVKGAESRGNRVAILAHRIQLRLKHS